MRSLLKRLGSVSRSVAGSLSVTSLASVVGLGLGVAALGACASPSLEDSSPATDDAITSNDGTPLEFRFTGEVTARSTDTSRKAIAAQLQYVQGILTSANQANGQASMPTLQNVVESAAGDKKKITYEASLAVIWPKGRTAPESYALALPKDVSATAAFNAKYDGTCGRNEYGQDTFWHDFNPAAAGCRLDEADVVRATASVRKHPQTTEGKFPEYDKIWADDSLDVVAVFGIIGSNTPSDEGARTREQLLEAARGSLQNAQRFDAPAMAGVIKDSTVSGTINIDGRAKKVNVTGILVQEASSAGSAFERRYAEVTTKADVIIYEGHSGLGSNINTLAKHAGATKEKYQLVYFYGCQTLAYLEPTMHEKRIALNGAASDPDGTKYLDIIATALPAYGDNGRSTLGLYRAVLDASAPKSFNDLIRGISPLHLTAVFGEHDNTFRP